MNKILISIALMLSVITTSFGQESPELTNTQVRAMILPLGISLEQKIGEKQTLVFAAGLQVGFYAYSNSFAGSGSEWYFAPLVNAEFRNYYDRKRVRKDNLGSNSGNYVALVAGRIMERLGDPENSILTNSQENSTFIGPVWGMQRNYASGFHLNISIGAGYQSGDYLDNDFGFISTGGIGFYFK